MPGVWEDRVKDPGSHEGCPPHQRLQHRGGPGPENSDIDHGYHLWIWCPFILLKT